MNTNNETESEFTQNENLKCVIAKSTGKVLANKIFASYFNKMVNQTKSDTNVFQKDSLVLISRTIKNYDVLVKCILPNFIVFI